MKAAGMKSMTVPNETFAIEIGRLLEEGSEVVFKPKGISMLPFIRGGRDSIILRKPSVLKAGDIVLARTDDSRYVVHRIISAEEGRLTLMGDGNVAGKEHCTEKDVLGVAVKIVRDGKQIDCQSPAHLRKARIWARLLPVRRYLLAIYKRINL